MNNVRAGVNLMLAMGPANIVVAGEAPIVPKSGVPTLGIAKIGVARNVKIGEAAVPQVVRIVGARNPEHSQSDVCAEVRCLAKLAHACKAHVPVNDKRG